jgi:hypothetical protein
LEESREELDFSVKHLSSYEPDILTSTEYMIQNNNELNKVSKEILSDVLSLYNPEMH